MKKVQRPNRTKKSSITTQGITLDSSGELRVAQQPRSLRTQKSILEAAEYLFGKQGYAGARVADIVKESGCSTGSFYHHFSDKEGLLNVMLEDYVQNVETLIENFDLTQKTHHDIHTLFVFLAKMVIELISSNRGLNFALREMVGLKFPGRNRLERLTVKMGNRMREVAQEYREEIKATDPEESTRHAIQIIIMVVLRTQLDEGPIFPKDRKKLTEMLARAACGILQVVPKGS